jgi:hypothetical protein
MSEKVEIHNGSFTGGGTDLQSISPPTQNSQMNSSSNSSGSSSSNNVVVADINAFTKYLKQVIPVLLDSSNVNNVEFDKVLNEKSSVECIKKFIGDPQVRSLMIQKLLAKGEFTFANCFSF